MCDRVNVKLLTLHDSLISFDVIHPSGPIHCLVDQSKGPSQHSSMLALQSLLAEVR